MSVAPLVRRAPDVALLRWVRSSPAATVLTQAGLIVLALLLTRAIYMWPETIPWGVYLPLIIAAGLSNGAGAVLLSVFIEHPPAPVVWGGIFFMSFL